MCVLNFGSGNAQNVLHYKLMAIVSSLCTISAYGRFHRNALVLGSKINMYFWVVKLNFSFRKLDS